MARTAADARTTLHAAVVPTTLGLLAVVADADAVIFTTFGEDTDDALDAVRRRFPSARIADADARTRAWAEATALAVEGSEANGVPVRTEGTPFQLAVWNQLRAIPRGETITYGELARRVGRPKAVRAVAQACGANPVGVLVPCHRVIGANGSLTGFASGVERKRALLEREGAL